MAEKNPEERIKELEAEVAKLKANQKSSSSSSTSTRVSDSLSNTSQNKIDLGGRAFRGMTLASVEGLRLFADTVSTFADGVVTRNGNRSGDTIRESTTRLPGDMVESFSDAFDKFIDIPSKTADKYSEVYKQGEKASTN